MTALTAYQVAAKLTAEIGCSINTATKWLDGRKVTPSTEWALSKALDGLGLSDWHPDVRAIKAAHPLETGT